jgi:hypothetical protein
MQGSQALYFLCVQCVYYIRVCVICFCYEVTVCLKVSVFLPCFVVDRKQACTEIERYVDCM